MVLKIIGTKDNAVSCSAWVPKELPDHPERKINSKEGKKAKRTRMCCLPTLSSCSLKLLPSSEEIGCGKAGWENKWDLSSAESQESAR